MTSRTALIIAATFAATAIVAPAQAEGLGIEGNYGRADGHWGAELGAGYAFGVGPISVTPGGGVFLRDGDVRVYGRVEANYRLPTATTVGAGIRVSRANTRPYATIAFPLLPLMTIKGNAGPKYYALGLTFGY